MKSPSNRTEHPLCQTSRCLLCSATQWVGVSSGVPKPTLRFSLVTKDSQNSGKLLHSGESTRGRSAGGKGAWSRAKRNLARASSCPLPVESYHSAMPCHNNDVSQHTQSIANQGNSPQTWFPELLLGVDHVDIPDHRCS